MKRYSHALDIAFEVISSKSDGEDITPTQLRMAILKRVIEANDTEILDICLPPFDSCEIDEEDGS